MRAFVETKSAHRMFAPRRLASVWTLVGTAVAVAQQPVTVAAGKVADFLFLDADPLVDIFNTRRIRAVVADGRFYDRSDLDSLLMGAERLAKQSRRP